MKTAFDSIEAFNKDNHCWNVIIETPKGSNVKYALDEKTGFLTLCRRGWYFHLTSE